MEVRRTKNVATYIVFPIVDADGDFVTGAAGLDSEIDAWADGGAPDGFTDCTNEATEIGSTGVYYLSLAQAEMNNDYIVIQIKTSTSGAKTQMVLINTTNQKADAVAISGDATAADNLEAACDGNTYNVGGGAVVAASVTAGVTLANDAITAAKFDESTAFPVESAGIGAKVDAVKAKTDMFPAVWYSP